MWNTNIQTTYVVKVDHDNWIFWINLGFINYIVAPSFQMLEDMLRKVYRDTKWKELDEKEKEMTSADDIPFPGGKFLSS